MLLQLPYRNKEQVKTNDVIYRTNDKIVLVTVGF